MTKETPRARVLTALAHKTPVRVPFSWGFGPTTEMAAVLTAYCRMLGVDWARLQVATEDIRRVNPRYIGVSLPPEIDIWGIRRAVTNYNHGFYDEISVYPLAGYDDPAALAKYPWPHPIWFGYATLREEILGPDPQRRHAVNLLAGNPFETYCWMTGLEEALMNLLVAPELVTAALDRITGFYEQKLARALRATGNLVDIVFMADDLGGQLGLLCARETYRAVIQPFHRRLVATARQYAPAAQVMFHTDGAVFEIIPDLLDTGIDILEAVQTDAAQMDPAALKATYGKHLSFHGAISVQQLLPNGTPESVAQACHELVKTLGANGGYIAAPSHAIQVGTPPENVLAMLRAVLGEADYATALESARL